MTETVNAHRENHGEPFHLFPVDELKRIPRFND